MFDYRVVCVYPLTSANEGLEGLDADVVEDLERSIATSIEEGWEYVYTTSYKNGAVGSDAGKRGVRTFVYRRCRATVEIANGDQQVTVSNVFGRVTETDAVEEAPEYARTPETPAPLAAKSLLTLALLNAALHHAEAEPATILSELRRTEEITPDEQNVLTFYLEAGVTPKALAKMAPTSMRHDIYRVSVMPSGGADVGYIDYLSELALYLDLDEEFVAMTTGPKRLPDLARRSA